MASYHLFLYNVDRTINQLFFTMKSTKKLGCPKGQTKDTKQIILEAGFNMFSTAGFAGTSISQIAKAAGINQSLIYHHFANKLDLWRAIKAHIVQRLQPRYLNPSKLNTLSELITEYIHSRFDFYYQNPDVLRLLLWQRLDKDQQALATNIETPQSPLYQALDTFQKKGELRADINLNLLIPMMSNMAIAPLIDCPGIFDADPTKTTMYKADVVKVILQGIMNT